MSCCYHLSSGTRKLKLKQSVEVKKEPEESDGDESPTHQPRKKVARKLKGKEIAKEASVTLVESSGSRPKNLDQIISTKLANLR